MSDPLFVGLTRPTLIFGVSLKFAVLNIMICVNFFIQTNDIRSLLIGFGLHIVGYILCFKEPRFMEIYLMKFGNFNKCYNKSYYGANSYDV